ncbi:DUF1290 domain-containing protein [Veillonella denticariosi JCM 15641]|uniref:DUF1290 domain-containing protein n=1 Tax=Veillonella denticariosi JCM 15641 TaxID=1298594 RepID=A0A2S7Z7W3_9FIRM|nr:small basic family protein [Veillonella denticariosi]PQL19285.1 DUF1290 domain-containing protein [Veillonella denticariosi JCM 15641]
MNIYIFAILGLLLGSLLGWVAPLHIPSSYANYTSVAVLAALDAVFGGSRAALERIFDLRNFISGFFSNVVIAVILVYIGDLIGINLYYVALIGFGLRVFVNIGAIRKNIMTKRF